VHLPSFVCCWVVGVELRPHSLNSCLLFKLELDKSYYWFLLKNGDFILRRGEGMAHTWDHCMLRRNCLGEVDSDEDGGR